MFSLSSTVKKTVPKQPFSAMKNTVLGKEYSLSLVFIGSTRSRTLNKKYKNKDKPTNILSFPLSDSEGEILIDLTQARKDARLFDRDITNFIGFLFIHGLFHLKGSKHGSTMEGKEEVVRKTFNI